MQERVVPNFDVKNINTKQLPDHVSQVNNVSDHAWYLRVELVEDSGRGFDIELRDEITFGIAVTDSNAADLKPFNGVDLGVSRRHLKLTVSASDLVIIDLNSTNGTRLNDRPIEPQTPYRLLDGDILSLGRLDLVVRVIMRPGESSADLRAQADLAEALIQIGKSLTAEMNMDEIFAQAIDLTISLTSAGEASIWIFDPFTEQFRLAASHAGSKPADPARTHPMLLRVLQTGESIRTRQQDLVCPNPDVSRNEALYVPMHYKKGVIGVLSAVHRSENRAFTSRDERLLEALADFVAIAVRNTALYQELQDADRLKGEMIQNIAHEFRTPLTYAVGYVALMLEDTDKLDPDHKTYLEVVMQQTHRLQWLIKNFVSLATLEQVVAERAPIATNMLIKEAYEAARIAAHNAGIELCLTAEPNLPVVQINALAILQVIDNFLSNALKFTPKGGRVTLQAAYDAQKSRVIFSVADTGIGIPENCRQRVFDRFYQVDGTATRRYSGVGIGLALCKAIVEAHGEDIWLESPSTGGCVFSFTMRPAAVIDEPAKIACEAAAGD